jgi:hypothetical protein
MSRLESHWKRLELQSSSALETLASLEAAVRRQGLDPDLGRVERVQTSANRLCEAVRERISSAEGEWEAWVDAETQWLELRFEIHGLAAAPGPLRAAFLESVREQSRRVEDEISDLVARSGRFRPRTRVAINQDVQRLRRRLDVLREEARRLEESGAGSGETAIRGMGDAWSDLSWNVEQTRKRFARPRRRQGSEPARPA